MEVEAANPGASMTPGLAGGLRDPSFVLRIRLPRCHVCGLLSSPTCPDSPGICALGRRRRPSGRLERGLPLRRRRRRVAGRRRALTPSAGWPPSTQGICGTGLAPYLRNRPLVSAGAWSDCGGMGMWPVWGSEARGDLRGMGRGAWPAGCRIAGFAVFCELPEGG